MTTVTVEGLRVSYAETVAVRGVDLSLESGDFLAVTGESGAGKSSLLWALAGAVAHDGSVHVENGRVGDPTVPQETSVALVPQTNGLAALLTAFENVVVPLVARGLEPAEAVARTDETLALVGLEGFGGHLVDELSGGQQQRVAVARALAARPALLLADEPTSALDHANRTVVLDLLAGAARGGAVVVMASHDAQALDAAGAVVLLEEGVASWLRPLARGSGRSI